MYIFTILKLEHKKNRFVHFLQSTEVNNVQPTCTSWFLCEGELWYKVLECPRCYNTLTHKVKHAKGDPRNLAHIGQWDGWSPYKSRNHKCGAIEVSIATMSKLERCSVDEVYVTGFVPSNQVPTDNPNALDPFLHPLVQEIKNGFIDGFEVERKGGLQGFQPEKVVIRHLLLC